MATGERGKRSVNRPAAHIVPMEHHHLDGAAEVERVCFPTPWGREALRQELERGDTACYIVAQTPEGSVVGYAGMWTAFDQAHVTTIGVLPDWRRQHIGERMLVALIEESRRRGCKMMALEHRVSNAAAKPLYDKYGFVEDGIRPRYYRDTMEDAVVRSIPSLDDEGFLKILERNVRLLRERIESED